MIFIKVKLWSKKHNYTSTHTNNHPLSIYGSVRDNSYTMICTLTHTHTHTHTHFMLALWGSPICGHVLKIDYNVLNMDQYTISSQIL